MNQLIRGEKNGKIKGMQKKWLQRSVGEFFTAINWEMQPLEVQQIKEAAWQGSNEPLSAMLSVSQFFSCFAWEGKKVAAPVPDSSKPPAAESGSNEFTLDDFSSLF